DIDVQALEQNLRLLAKLDITQQANRIHITAQQEVVINGAGSYTRWSAAGIESGTSSAWTAKAASHGFTGPASKAVQPPDDIQPFNEMFVLKDKAGRPVKNFPYRIKRADGVEITGLTDEHGRTHRMGSGSAAQAMDIEADH
ncbi:DUF2345 domain-containing protein, partial [Roseateles sp. BYS180W]